MFVMHEMLFNKMIEVGVPEFIVVYDFTDVEDRFVYKADESGFICLDNIREVTDEVEQDINASKELDIEVSTEITVIDGVAALIVKFDCEMPVKVEEEETNNNNNIEEEVVMNKNTKVVVSMVNGEVKVNGLKGKEYNVVLHESFTNTIKEYNNTIHNLNVELTDVTAKMNHYKTRYDAAVKYYKENEGKSLAENLNVKIEDKGVNPVNIPTGHFCEDCGRQITDKAAKYCEDHAETFDGHVYCYNCQRTHARRA
jgi:hypothetical protein